MNLVRLSKIVEEWGILPLPTKSDRTRKILIGPREGCSNLLRGQCNINEEDEDLHQPDNVAVQMRRVPADGLVIQNQARRSSEVGETSTLNDSAYLPVVVR